jgi:hypothetical protein
MVARSRGQFGALRAGEIGRQRATTDGKACGVHPRPKDVVLLEYFHAEKHMPFFMVWH